MNLNYNPCKIKFSLSSSSSSPLPYLLPSPSLPHLPGSRWFPPVPLWRHAAVWLHIYNYSRLTTSFQFATLNFIIIMVLFICCHHLSSYIQLFTSNQFIQICHFEFHSHHGFIYMLPPSTVVYTIINGSPVHSSLRL